MMKRLTALFLMIVLLCGCIPAQAATKFKATDPTQARLDALALLETCALGSEYGGGRDFVLRWEEPLYIYVGGKPTKADRTALNDLLLDIALRVPEAPPMFITTNQAEANVTIWYVKLKELPTYIANYTEGNWGYFTYWYQNNAINELQIGIATDVTNQKERNHLIQEEFIGGLGLANDHYAYSDSILYQPWTTVQQPSEVDWMMLNMLYSRRIRSGDNWSTVYNALYNHITGR